MIYTAPVGILGLGILYLYLGQKLKHLEFNSAKRQFLQQQLKEFGALSTDQLKVLIIAITLFVFWLLPSIMPFLLGQDAGVTLFIKNHFSESSSAVLIASLLFIVPSSSGQRLLSWSKAKDIDWGTLLLFGGGLSLGKMIVSSGLGNELARLTHLGASGMSFPVFIFFVCAFAIFFTETSSNTAAANVLIPISLSLAITFGFNLTLTALGVALACNFAFMLPIATPPNAIVFGSKLVSLRSMAKMGFALNLFFLVFLTSYLVVLDQAL